MENRIESRIALLARHFELIISNQHLQCIQREPCGRLVTNKGMAGVFQALFEQCGHVTVLVSPGVMEISSLQAGEA